MQAIAYTHPLPITDPLALQDVHLPDPSADGHDLLVEVAAVAVNPVDAKVRSKVAPDAGESYKVLGWDACGIVRAVGEQVSLFRPGDRVWYAGAINRAGCNSRLHLVDERIVGRAPQSLDDAQAAAMPLTSITAWELLFDRLGVRRDDHDDRRALLIIGAAGGVGSMLIQLARRLTALTVIATASREESRQWVSELGAHHVIDHNQPLTEELQRIGMAQVELVASLTHSKSHYAQIVQALAPQGRLALIDDVDVLDIRALKSKSISLHWEFMFTRPLYATEDMIAQHHLLNEVSALVDSGFLRSTLTRRMGTINANNLRHAHELIESGRSIGKMALQGWDAITR
ncbi:MAG: zinc-binding alcohol dehydrogenase family protein [Pseudomonadota bacterium]